MIISNLKNRKWNWYSERLNCRVSFLYANSDICMYRSERDSTLLLCVSVINILRTRHFHLRTKWDWRDRTPPVYLNVSRSFVECHGSRSKEINSFDRLFNRATSQLNFESINRFLSAFRTYMYHTEFVRWLF